MLRSPSLPVLLVIFFIGTAASASGASSKDKKDKYKGAPYRTADTRAALKRSQGGSNAPTTIAAEKELHITTPTQKITVAER